MDCSTPGFPVHHQLPELAQLMSIESAMPPDHFILCFPLLLQSFPASQSFPISQFFESGGKSIGPSASASVLPMKIQDWFPLGLTGWISLQSKGLSRVFSSTTAQKHQFFSAQLSLWSNSHISHDDNILRAFFKGKYCFSPITLYIRFRVILIMNSF